MIKAGDNLPDGAVMIMEDAAPKKISVSELLGDKKSIIFGVPGAFTPSCSAKSHLQHGLVSPHHALSTCFVLKDEELTLN